MTKNAAYMRDLTQTFDQRESDKAYQRALDSIERAAELGRFNDRISLDSRHEKQVLEKLKADGFSIKDDVMTVQFGILAPTQVPCVCVSWDVPSENP